VARIELQGDINRWNFRGELVLFVNNPDNDRVTFGLGDFGEINSEPYVAGRIDVSTDFSEINHSRVSS
jgi:hypothetical protein